MYNVRAKMVSLALAVTIILSMLVGCNRANEIGNGSDLIPPTTSDATSAGDEEASENNGDSQMQQALEWFASQYSRDFEVLLSDEHYGSYVVLTGTVLPGVDDAFGALQVFIIREENSVFTVVATGSSETAMGAGFSASTLYASGMTVLFGDVSDSVYDFDYDELKQVNFTGARVFIDGVSTHSITIANSTPYLLIIDGVPNISEIEYYGDNVNVRFTDFFDIESLL